MDKDAAAKYADDNAEATSQGQCAKYVRKALEAGGLDLSKHPYSAKDYGPFLTGQGLLPVPAAGYTPAKGDVVVIQNYQGGDVNGHIALHDGTQWVPTSSSATSGPVLAAAPISRPCRCIGHDPHSCRPRTLPHRRPGRGRTA